MRNKSIFYTSGSSPRVWGQEYPRAECRCQNGIIPTRVGTSVYVVKLRCDKRDHPHACGDKASVALQEVSETGSSPRVWGQVIVCKLDNGNIRIIPTRVGTRSIDSVHHHSREDHPHACGDKSTAQFFLRPRVGSSPRVWGQGPPIWTTFLFSRIIPTRVGTRCSNCYKIKKLQDHPHACGDK